MNSVNEAKETEYRVDYLGHLAAILYYGLDTKAVRVERNDQYGVLVFGSRDAVASTLEAFEDNELEGLLCEYWECIEQVIKGYYSEQAF